MLNHECVTSISQLQKNIHINARDDYPSPSMLACTIKLVMNCIKYVKVNCLFYVRAQ